MGSALGTLWTSTSARDVAEAVRTVDTWFACLTAVSFFILQFGGQHAAYGRYSSDWAGLKVPGLVDWVLHATALVSVARAVDLDAFRPAANPAAAAFLAAYFAHYVNRSFVFAYEMWATGQAVKPIPVLTLAMGSFFCLCNGLVIGRFMTKLADYPADYVYSGRFVVGMGLWAAGFVSNKWHDRRLLALKKKSGGVYVIPTGGLFDYVSGANFFSEIVEWWGYALATDFSLPAVTFAIVTSLNIGPRASHHHDWYLEKFPDYPKHRKRLVPFVY